MNDLLFDVVKVIVAVVAVLISTYLVPYLKSLAKNEKYARLVEFINTAVHAAEQTIKGSGMGEKRYAEVERQVTEWLNGKGIEITQEQLSILIESAVFSMNQYRYDWDDDEDEEPKKTEPLYAD